MKSTEQNGFTEAWERSKPFMVTALEKSGNEYDIDDLLTMIEEDRAIFYPVRDGAAIFRVSVYPRKRRLRFWLIGVGVGGFGANIDAVMEAADFCAQQYGCDSIELTGRRAWEKMLKPYGYEPNSVVLIKELGD